MDLNSTTARCFNSLSRRQAGRESLCFNPSLLTPRLSRRKFRPTAADARPVARGMSTAGRTCRMRQEEGGHVASQRARDPRRRLCQLLQGMPAGGRLDSELLALRETVWRARGVQPGHEFVFGGCDGDEQRREVGVQGATGGQRGRCAAGHVFGFVPRLYCGRRRALVHAVRRRGGCAARFVSSSRFL